jgi:hypothetical protein
MQECWGVKNDECYWLIKKGKKPCPFLRISYLLISMTEPVSFQRLLDDHHPFACSKSFTFECIEEYTGGF